MNTRKLKNMLLKISNTGMALNCNVYVSGNSIFLYNHSNMVEISGSPTIEELTEILKENNLIF
ncbi:hypothetical protein [Psychrobacillus phage Perkons]|nr:hypothetical protein [Psychrobacillus phage Perkons]